MGCCSGDLHRQWSPASFSLTACEEVALRRYGLLHGRCQLLPAGRYCTYIRHYLPTYIVLLSFYFLFSLHSAVIHSNE